LTIERIDRAEKKERTRMAAPKTNLTLEHECKERQKLK